MLNNFQNPQAARDALISSVIEAIEPKGFNILYLSGGSAASCYPQLASVLADMPTVKLMIAQVDERHYENSSIEPDESVYNSIQLAQIFTGQNFKTLFIPKKIGSNLTDALSQYNIWLQDSPLNNLAILGIGNDLHIAGVKPQLNPLEFTKKFESDATYITYQASDFPLRTTITITGIKKLDKAFIYLENKPEVVNFLQNKSSDATHKFPAACVDINIAEIFAC